MPEGTEEINYCEQVFSYFLNEMPPHEASAFKQHLKTCQACRDELTELQQAWQTLPYEMDEVEVPESLKAEMLNHILNEIEVQEGSNEAAAIAKPAVSNEKAVPAVKVNRKAWSFAAAAIIFMMVGAAAGWGLNEYRLTLSNSGSKLAAPAQMVEQYALKAFDPNMPAASGHCWIKQQGKDQQLIVQVNGLKENLGDQAYQVWIVKEGTRFDGGTFQVDEKGSGVLTHNLKPMESNFDTIGITLEPDAIGTKPRGKKVLGS